MCKKFQALNHTKSRQMDPEKEFPLPFLPIGPCRGQFRGMLRQNKRSFKSPRNPRDISSQNQARSLKAWFESSLHRAKGGCPHYTSCWKAQRPIQATLCKQSGISYFPSTQVNFSTNVVWLNRQAYSGWKVTCFFNQKEEGCWDANL